MCADRSTRPLDFVFSSQTCMKREWENEEYGCSDEYHVHPLLYGIAVAFRLLYSPSNQHKSKNCLITYHLAVTAETNMLFVRIV